MEYLHPQPIRFADVDAAGIVYYPRFFHYYHQAFEDFFAAVHGLPYPAWIEERRVGFPTRHVVADYASPLRYGEELTVAVTVPRRGRTSLDFFFSARVGEREAAWARVTKVCVDLDTLRPQEIPGDLAEACARHTGDEERGR